MALIANDIGVPGAGRARRRRARGRRGHRQGRLGLGRAPGRRRLVAHPAHRGRSCPTTPPADQVPETNTPMSGHGHPAAQPDPAAVRRGRAERRRPQGAQGHPQEGREDEDGLIAGLPVWVGAVVTYVGGPLLLLAAAARRRRRRSRRWRRHRRRSADVGLGPLRRRLARAGRPRPRPGPARAARADGDPARAVGGHRVRRGRRAGPPRRQLRLRPERARGRAAATTYWESVDAERRAMSHEVGRWQRLRAAISLRSLRRRRSRSAPRTPPEAAREDPPRPSASPAAGAPGCAGSLIGVLAGRLTKLVRRPNVGCVSWCLAAARISHRLVQTIRRVPGKRLPRAASRGPPVTCVQVPGGSRANGRQDRRQHCNRLWRTCRRKKA